MKIGFDAKRAFYNQTGLGNYSRSIISSVSKVRKNDQIYLITPHSKTDNFKIYNQNTQIVTPPFLSNKKYWRFKGVNKQLKKIGIDIYHGLSNELPYKINCKSVVTIHDLLFLKYPNFYNYIDRKIYYLKSKIACQQANAIIATSEQTKKDIINFLKIKEDKIHAIYQTCQPEFINYKTHKTINIKEPYILYVGSIEERKNLIFLLQAIKEMNPEIKLVCVGRKYKYYKKVQNFIQKYKLTQRVSFLNIDDTSMLAALYRKSRALIYPSIDEGFGIPIIEAMYSKIPVITSNKAIFKEIGGKNSYYFEEANLESLIEKISEVWTDSKKRDDKIEKNFQYVQKFNDNTQVQKIIEIYKSLI